MLETPVHSVNYWSVLWCCLGLAMSIALQVDAIARSEVNPETSRTKLFADRAIRIAYRAGACVALFILVLQGQLLEYMNALGVQVPDTLRRVLEIHITGAAAFLAGLGMDALLSFIPWLRAPAIDK